MDAILENLDETNNKEFEFLVKQHLKDEKCLGVFRTTNPRDDGLPTLFLHSSECWHRMEQSCPDLPDMDEHEEGVLLDYDFYHPTLHYLLDELVYGDTSLPGCYMDRIRINQMINENA